MQTCPGARPQTLPAVNATIMDDAPDSVDTGALDALLAYWRAKCAGRRMPKRSDINPAEIPRLLSVLTMIDRVGERFRFRLVGTAIVEAIGADPTGQFIDELLPPARLASATHFYRRVFDERRPLRNRAGLGTGDDLKVIASRLAVPLSEDGVTVNIALTGMILQGGWYSLRGSLAGATSHVIHETIFDVE